MKLRSMKRLGAVLLLAAILCTMLPGPFRALASEPLQSEPNSEGQVPEHPEEDRTQDLQSKAEKAPDGNWNPLGTNSETAVPQAPEETETQEKIPSEGPAAPEKAPDVQIPEEKPQEETDPAGETIPEESTPAQLPSRDPEETGDGRSLLELYEARLEFLNRQPSAIPAEFYLQPSEAAVRELEAIRALAAGDQTYHSKHMHLVGWAEAQQAFTLPSGKSRNKFLEYALDIDGNGKLAEQETAYCLEPYEDVLSGEIYNSTETSANVSDPSPWGGLTADQQRAIGLILLYGYPASVCDGKTTNQRLCDQLVTGIMVHEVVLGWREAVPPYRCTDDSYIRIFMDSSCGARFETGSFVENAGITGDRLDHARVKDTYDRISRSLAAHRIPGFAVESPQSVPVYTMEPAPGGKYTVTLRDSAGVLAGFTPETLPGLTASVRGNDLILTADSPDAIPEAPMRLTGPDLPSAENSAFLIWNGNKNGRHSQDQICLRPGGARSAPLSAYIRLAPPPTGSVHIRKTTEDGENLEGWQFEITRKRDGSSGIFTSDAAGEILVPDLSAEVYTVREVGHTDPVLDEMYRCSGSRTKTVSILPGKTAEVTFHNRLAGGMIRIRKTTYTGPLEGWLFEVRDSGGKEVLGSPFLTREDGSITTPALKPGTYTVRELLPEDSPYACRGENPQTVTVAAGKTAEVRFLNALKPGRVTVRKQDPEGNALAGAEFLLEWSPDGKTWQPVRYEAGEAVFPGGCSDPACTEGKLVTGPDGTAVWERLDPRLQYRITETRAPEGFSLAVGIIWKGTLPAVTPEYTVTVTDTRLFTLPHTGSSGLLRITGAVTLAAGLCLGALCILKRKEA